MKCLLTGSAGYLGSHILQRLQLKNYDLVAVFHHQKPTPQENILFIQGDIQQDKLYKELPQDIDLIIHCASLVRDYGPKKEFYNINVDGTKKLTSFAKKCNIDQFIYIGHIGYGSKQSFSYTDSKKKAEIYLLNEYKKTGFPVTILSPGNIFGPAANIWVIRILNNLANNTLSLINHGNGIFHHTYIDNFVDALLLTMKNPAAIGQRIYITDGDNSITFGKYFSDLANILGIKASPKNISKSSALLLSHLLSIRYTCTGTPPIITPLAVDLLTNQTTVSIKKANQLLSYKPNIVYKEAMVRIHKWIENNYK